MTIDLTATHDRPRGRDGSASVVGNAAVPYPVLVITDLCRSGGDRLATLVRALTSHPVLVGPATAADAIRQRFPQVKSIYLVRDLRDEIASMYAATDGLHFGRDTVESDVAYLQLVVAQWAAAVAKLEAETSALVVRFEDLCATPELEVQRIAAYLGVDEAGVRTLLGAGTTPDLAHPGPNGCGEEQVGRWRRDAPQLAPLIDGIGGHLLKRFGYQPAAHSAVTAPNEGVANVGLALTGLHCINFASWARASSRELHLVIGNEYTNFPATAREERMACQLLGLPMPVLIHMDFHSIERSKARLDEAIAVIDAAAPDARIRLVSGGFHVIFTWALAHALGDRLEELVFVDDGVGTAVSPYFNRLNPRHHESDDVRLQAKKAGVNPDHDLPATFYSAFLDATQVAPGDTILLDDRSFLRGLSLERAEADDSVIYFLGQPLSRYGDVTIDDTLLVRAALAWLRLRYPDKQAVYVAHRAEPAAKLEALTEVVEIRSKEYPFELSSIVTGKRPTHVVSFTSSALLSANEVLGGTVQVESLRLPRTTLHAEKERAIEDLYRMLESRGIPIVEPEVWMPDALASNVPLTAPPAAVCIPRNPYLEP